jgi:D-amino-acid dehydrogenase
MQNEIDKTDILIIGGGVIGVCVAYYLRQRGASVTLVEKGEIAAGASYGNAGWVVPSHSIPLPTPDAVKNGLKWMLNPASPFYIKPRLDLDLLAWLLKFAMAARPGPMHRAIPVLRDLNLASRYLFDVLAAVPGLHFDYHQQGMLMAYKTPEGYAGAKHEADLLHRYGLACELLSADQTLAIAPMLKPNLAGGLFFPDDAHMNPALFVRNLAAHAQAMGVTILTHTEVTGFDVDTGHIKAVQTSNGAIEVQQVVLAAGAWSPLVARELNLHLPVQAGKGYSVTLNRPANAAQFPIGLAEARVVTSPYENSFRLAGTMELGGMNLDKNQRRIDAIVQAARANFEGLEAIETTEVWQGLRPCTPDGLPVIDRAPDLKNLILATGHAMMGLSLGPITGKLVAQLACGEKPSIDLGLLKANRF